MNFGDKSCQYVKPMQFSRVNLLYLNNIDADLHQISQFAAETLAISKLWISNRAFKLFSDRINIDDMIGTTLPATLESSQSDRANL